MTDSRPAVPPDLPDELEAVLAEQLRLVGENRLREAAALTPRVNELLPAAEGRADADGARRIVDLHRKLLLTLAARRDETGGQLRRLAEGRKAGRAYGTHA